MRGSQPVPVHQRIYGCLLRHARLCSDVQEWRLVQWAQQLHMPLGFRRNGLRPAYLYSPVPKQWNVHGTKSLRMQDAIFWKRLLDQSMWRLHRSLLFN